MVRSATQQIAISVWVAVVFSPTQGAASDQQNKPVKIERLSITPKGPTLDSSLYQMMTDADAVIRGRVVGSSPRDRDLDRGADQPPVKGGRVMTAFHIKVLEIFHATGDHAIDLNTTLDFMRDGGDRDRGTYIQRVVATGMPILELGHEYVLFLKWSPYRGGWTTPYGSDGALDITKGVVESGGRATITERHKGMRAADMLNELRHYGQK